MRLGRGNRRFRLTREGKAFLFVTIGVGLAAVNTANNLLYLVLGLLLSLLLVSGVLSDLALWRLRVSRRLPKQMFVGSDALVEVCAQNLKERLASIGVEARDDLDGLQAEPSHFVRVGPRSQERVPYRCTPLKRGRLKFNKLRVMTRYPFGLIEKGYTVLKEDEAVVYPRLLGSIAPPPFEEVVGDARPTHRTGYGSEFSGSIRQYHQGDATRDIHWRRTAARGELLVRERELDSRALVTLYIDNGVDSSTLQNRQWLESFEDEISRIATIAGAYLSRGISVQVQTRTSASPTVAGGTDPDPIWRYLALLEPALIDAEGDATKERAA